MVLRFTTAFSSSLTISRTWLAGILCAIASRTLKADVATWPVAVIQTSGSWCSLGAAFLSILVSGVSGILRVTLRLVNVLIKLSLI